MLKLSVDTRKTDPVWIISNPRVGSTYLCSLLNNVIDDQGQLLFFPPQFREHYIRQPNKYKHGCPPPYYNKLHWILYEICLHPTNLDELVPDLKYVRIKRLDYANVAVSMHIKDCGKKRKKVDYDEEQLLYYHQLARDRDALWDDYLKDRQHLSFEYNDVVKNPHNTIEKIVRYSGYTGDYYLNLDSHSISIKSEHVLKDELRERFKSCLTQCMKL